MEGEEKEPTKEELEQIEDEQAEAEMQEDEEEELRDEERERSRKKTMSERLGPYMEGGEKYKIFALTPEENRLYSDMLSKDHKLGNIKKAERLILQEFFSFAKDLCIQGYPDLAQTFEGEIMGPLNLSGSEEQGAQKVFNKIISETEKTLRRERIGPRKWE